MLHYELGLVKDNEQISENAHHIVVLTWEFAVAGINDTLLGARRSKTWTIGPFAWAVVAILTLQARLVIGITSKLAFFWSVSGGRLLNEFIMVRITGGRSAFGRRLGCSYFAGLMAASADEGQ